MSESRPAVSVSVVSDYGGRTAEDWDYSRDTLRGLAGQLATHLQSEAIRLARWFVLRAALRMAVYVHLLEIGGMAAAFAEARAGSERS